MVTFLKVLRNKFEDYEYKYYFILKVTCLNNLQFHDLNSI